MIGWLFLDYISFSQPTRWVILDSSSLSLTQHVYGIVIWAFQKGVTFCWCKHPTPPAQHEDTQIIWSSILPIFSTPDVQNGTWKSIICKIIFPTSKKMCLMLITSGV